VVAAADQQQVWSVLPRVIRDPEFLTTTARQIIEADGRSCSDVDAVYLFGHHGNLERVTRCLPKIGCEPASFVANRQRSRGSFREPKAVNIASTRQVIKCDQQGATRLHFLQRYQRQTSRKSWVRCALGGQLTIISERTFRSEHARGMNHRQGVHWILNVIANKLWDIVH
jgi:hypothetical protein